MAEAGAGEGVPRAMARGKFCLAAPSGASNQEEGMSGKLHLAILAAVAATGLAISGPAGSHGMEEHGPGSDAEAMPHGMEEHGHGSDAGTILEQMREMHRGHEHGHDFAAIESMSSAEMNRVMTAMMDIGLAVPPMDAHHGRELFVERGCIVCHQINGVGGEVGPSLDAAAMPVPMNAFEFAARMWRGAGAMIEMQEQLLGEQITLTGQELADLVAFAHDESEQQELSPEEVPEAFRELID